MEAKHPFSDQDWQATPEPVRQYIRQLEQTIAVLVNKVKELEKRTEKLESKTNQHSQNSSKPPSSESEAKGKISQHFGKNILKELQLLCHWAKAPPDEDQWGEFYQRFIDLIFDHHQLKNEAGTLARSLIRQIDSLWVFLEVSGVEPTNNRAERTLRFGVLWRKRSKGTQSEKGNRWVERVLSFKQTCQMRSLPSFPLLVDAIGSFFKEQKPNLDWL